MTNSSFQSGIQFAWDATSITAAATCSRKYYYSLIRGISPRAKSVHLIFGGHYATALEHFYKYRAAGQDYESALLQVVHKALIDSWNEEEKRPQDFIHAAKTRIGLIRSIVWYLDKFAREEGAMTTHHLRDGTPSVEVSFSIDINNDLVFCGHLDRIVSYSDALWIMDQKTTGSALSSYYFDQFKPDIQMSGYTWAGQIITESPIKGVIIDAAQINVGGTNYARGFTHRTEAELQEWWQAAMDIINRTRDYSAQADSGMFASPEQAFPMNPTACGNYDGCPFRSICSSSPTIRESVIKTEFVPHTWDPLERR